VQLPQDAQACVPLQLQVCHAGKIPETGKEEMKKQLKSLFQMKIAASK
jgi:hypothetical protein